MGNVKRYLEHVIDVLQVSHEEVEGMSLSEIDTMLKNHEHSLEKAVDDIEEQLEQDLWDVDIDENGPFLCSIKKES
jgi:DNA-binding transcriptional MerR regulator